MEEIIGNLYLGSFAEVEDIRSNIHKGFVACLSIGKEFSLEDIEKTLYDLDKTCLPNLNKIGIAHKRFPIIDGTPNVICRLLPKAISMIDDHINKGNVYVHCHAGVSRSASIVFGYLLHKGYDPMEAFKILVNKRGVVNPYDKFICEILFYFGFKNPELITQQIYSKYIFKD